MALVPGYNPPPLTPILRDASFYTGKPGGVLPGMTTVYYVNPSIYGLGSVPPARWDLAALKTWLAANVPVDAELHFDIEDESIAAGNGCYLNINRWGTAAVYNFIWGPCAALCGAARQARTQCRIGLYGAVLQSGVFFYSIPPQMGGANAVSICESANEYLATPTGRGGGGIAQLTDITIASCYQNVNYKDGPTSRAFNSWMAEQARKVSNGQPTSAYFTFQWDASVGVYIPANFSSRFAAELASEDFDYITNWGGYDYPAGVFTPRTYASLLASGCLQAFLDGFGAGVTA